ncbi:hypothetical protein [Flavobacterium gawalongense]|uniref:SGNH/GDSL hydrolase family protein n=1 Tax=Flavobacterium gawalongense TaxID=2594432 RepID=A0A553BYT7_9FLAO|nr:hypothetical protein [Flavobacterium gawalongense]TRX13490.1 hypothetical protein FNW11_01135 [Flavobacterium gawalongense]TRX15578.1 hypothetical protein FNW10_00555 [Flavobacterium gawalongense]TRX31417.1 hypothetical protein FNW38_00555 [Flavobacterium gawalongense]
MKNFLRLTSQISVTIFLLLVVLDFFYTTVYLHSSKRGKIEEVFNSKSQRLDVVFLGSSRANNHFVAPMFADKGLKTFNFGMSGGHLFEASLLLQLMIERKYIIRNVIVEADLNLSYEGRADGVAAKFLPYIHQSETIKNHFSGESDFFACYYVPFYRYIAYETKIGFREAFFTAIHKEGVGFKNLGYYPLGVNPKANMKNDIRNLKPVRNKHYENIKRLCKENKINLIAIMTPMCSNTKGLDYFQKVNTIYPEIHNYEDVVQGDQYFSSCGHLNDSGARLFTKIILKDFFKK